MDRKTWNQHVQKHAPAFGGFLQSWEWGAFQQSLGRHVERIYEETPSGSVLAQAIRMDLPFGQYYWFIPKGPLGTAEGNDALAVLRKQLPDGVFLRVEPNEDWGIPQVKEVHPATSLVLNVTKSEEALFAEMKSKTRYNIRLAKRKGVTCRMVSVAEYFDDFVRIMEQTAVRDGIRVHPNAYYRAQLEYLQEGDVQAKLAMAFYEERPIAANVIVDFGDQRTYLHGATSNLHRNVMAQYALHWHVIEDAKAQGMKSFDFYGIAPEDAGPKHSWYGITRYKKGYGGDVVISAGTFELQTKHIWYLAYRGLKVLRNIKR